MLREELWQKNRYFKLRPRMGRHWCDGCDANLVGAGRKCGYCNSKPIRRRMKKGTY